MQYVSQNNVVHSTWVLMHPGVPRINMVTRVTAWCITCSIYYLTCEPPPSTLGYSISEHCSPLDAITCLK